MKTTLIGLLLAVSTMGASVARADWDHRGPGPGPRFANRGGGHYEPRTFQAWVPGQAQQVWEPGRCWQRWGPPRCSPGHYRTVVSEGHYETRTDWVWVPHHGGPRFGLRVESPGGRAAVAFGAPYY